MCVCVKELRLNTRSLFYSFVALLMVWFHFNLVKIYLSGNWMAAITVHTIHSLSFLAMLFFFWWREELVLLIPFNQTNNKKKPIEANCVCVSACELWAVSMCLLYCLYSLKTIQLVHCSINANINILLIYLRTTYVQRVFVASHIEACFHVFFFTSKIFACFGRKHNKGRMTTSLHTKILWLEHFIHAHVYLHYE